ncbi:PepSY domain-containing protein [Vagococcus silagei]|uniref:Peptidase n=1 Tax=Vagococcus silagei TaxID=2508885 RepID=A0A4S3B3P3_9ENTE|nr:PepSY domain-containing protein [Vagococcus silagei]THB60877.1 peptidase [Vagococcus silagei]
MFTSKRKKQSNFQDGLTAGVGVGLIIGLASGALATYWYKKNRTLSADDILEQVKTAFLQEGPIEGSWIHFKKEPAQKFAIKSKVYTGGISRIEDGDLAQYEFIADAHTGSIVDIYRL